eukprot:7382821-Prymnesium_polylepis.1
MVSSDGSATAEIPKLDEQIVDLRRRHDRLHDSNHRKRQDLNLLADKLKDLHCTKYKRDETPQERLRLSEARLADCASRYGNSCADVDLFLFFEFSSYRYDEEHRMKMTYEQVIKRLKNEQLGFPAEVKALESTLSQKEADYEQLLMMSHDANQSKEHAKQELSKFEALVSEERKLRERELQERRVVLQKKQQLASELDKTERERRSIIQEQSSRVGEDSAKQQVDQTDKLIQEEQRKIAAYEAAFQQIKEATGVADVNEVIQSVAKWRGRLVASSFFCRTRESQGKIEELRTALEVERQHVLEAQYSLAQIEGRDDGPPDRASNAAARQALERSRARWKKLFSTMVNCKSAVQHVLDVLEPLRGEDEVIAPLTDETLLQHLQQIERKLQRWVPPRASIDQHRLRCDHCLGALSQHCRSILRRGGTARRIDAFVQGCHAEGSALAAAASSKRFSNKSARIGEIWQGRRLSRRRIRRRHRRRCGEENPCFLLDREALKKQARSIVDKGAKKKKLARKRRPRADDGDEKKPPLA